MTSEDAPAPDRAGTLTLAPTIPTNLGEYPRRNVVLWPEFDFEGRAVQVEPC